jgi:DNA-directed RNA polymerase specialized sigma24 family protein
MILIHGGLEGLRHAETATRLGLSRDTVAKRWQRMRAKLERERLPRELLQDE